MADQADQQEGRGDASRALAVIHGATDANARANVAHVQRTRMQEARGDGLRGGLIAGVIAGAALLLYAALTCLVAGYDPWLCVKVAAAPLLGARVLMPGFDALAVGFGLIDHFAVAGLWGMLFGAFFFGISLHGTIAVGALWGALVWLAMFYVVLPLFGVGQLAGIVPAGAAAFQHVLFGLALALGFLPVQRVRRSVRSRLPA